MQNESKDTHVHRLPAPPRVSSARLKIKQVRAGPPRENPSPYARNRGLTGNRRRGWSASLRATCMRLGWPALPCGANRVCGILARKIGCTVHPQTLPRNTGEVIYCIPITGWRWRPHSEEQCKQTRTPRTKDSPYLSTRKRVHSNWQQRRPVFILHTRKWYIRHIMRRVGQHNYAARKTT